ncbi:hypothetical protein CC80DRAFT_495954 [Byssothecium circinans]|uniref:Uncharacterized protein n=1 Tax=Byssothecium circinans TaxID=147558 RepID=A0A6A5TIS3_9PLEO|nr:hypothetical protein CC80DRAFT_495954 [Byssothecium circinans]
MASESPKSAQMASLKGVETVEGWNENLFYAYAQKSDYAQSPPYILTFANASVCDQWWRLVQREYPDSSRIGPQLFVLKGDDLQEQIQDNPKFYDLRNKWFYTPGNGVIPLQDYKGHPVTTTPTQRPAVEEKKPEAFDMKALSTALDKMNDMISENSAQIRALSVAQSEGLQRMQEINESNTLQIKALAESQAKLQNMVNENASQYIALSNSSFANNEQIKSVLQSTATQTKALADGQVQLSKTCEGMMRTIDNLGQTVGRVSENMSMIGSAASDAGSSTTNGSIGALANRISPPPRKLNRKIKGVWYEYDPSPTPVQSPRKKVNFLDTPPKSPLATKQS